MKIIALILCVLYLSSCSSSPETPETKYYLLNAPTINQSSHLTVRTVHETPKQEVVLLIDVAEYLQQPFIAMQLDEHTLYYAQSHLWAEPLKSEIIAALAHELNAASYSHSFTLVKGNAAKLPKDKLFINIEHFHASNTGKIILTGHHQWLNHGIENTKANEYKQEFYLETALIEDGFTHSISKMRALLTRLASEIINQSNTKPTAK